MSKNQIKITMENDRIGAILDRLPEVARQAALFLSNAAKVAANLSVELERFRIESERGDDE